MSQPPEWVQVAGILIWSSALTLGVFWQPRWMHRLMRRLVGRVDTIQGWWWRRRHPISGRPPVSSHPGGWTAADVEELRGGFSRHRHTIPDGPPFIPGIDVHLGKRWGQGDIDQAAAEGRLTEHMAEHGFYPEGEEPT